MLCETNLELSIDKKIKSLEYSDDCVFFVFYYFTSMTQTDCSPMLKEKGVGAFVWAMTDKENDEYCNKVNQIKLAHININYTYVLKIVTNLDIHYSSVTFSVLSKG